MTRAPASGSGHGWWSPRTATTRALVVLSLVGMLLAGAGELSPALAHPGGGLNPPHARLSADADVVTVEWTAPPDDAAHVGETVGVLPPGTMEAFLTGPEEDLPTDEQERELATSPQLEGYFLDHIQVRQDGELCPGEVTIAPDFFEDGAEVRFTCPEEIEEVDVRVTVLHDEDPRYDTFGVDGTVWTVLFTSAQPEHRWDAPAAGGAATIPVALYVAAAVLVLALVGWLLFSRRLRKVRRRPRASGAGGGGRRARVTRRRTRRPSGSLERS